MKTITASWMISCALLCGCSASSGSEGDNAPNGPANDSYEDGDHENGNTKPSPTYEFKPPTWQVPSKDIPLVPSYPDPEGDSGPSGEEGTPSNTDPSGTEGGGGAGEPLPTIIPPTIVDGNPGCSDVFDDAAVQQLDVTRLRDGTYSTSDNAFSVTLGFSGHQVSYTTTGSLIGVIVKGGPHANVYQTTAQTGDVTTAAGEDISHVTFCFVAK